MARQIPALLLLVMLQVAWLLFLLPVLIKQPVQLAQIIIFLLILVAELEKDYMSYYIIRLKKISF